MPGFNFNICKVILVFNSTSCFLCGKQEQQHTAKKKKQNTANVQHEARGKCQIQTVEDVLCLQEEDERDSRISKNNTS